MCKLKYVFNVQSEMVLLVLLQSCFDLNGTALSFFRFPIFGTSLFIVILIVTMPRSDN